MQLSHANSLVSVTSMPFIMKVSGILVIYLFFLGEYPAVTGFTFWCQSLSSDELTGRKHGQVTFYKEMPVWNLKSPSKYTIFASWPEEAQWIWIASRKMDHHDLPKGLLFTCIELWTMLLLPKHMIFSY